MANWMEKFERENDERVERELNKKLEELLDLLRIVYNEEKKVNVLEKIIDVYDELRINAYDYDEKDYISKKKQLAELKCRSIKEKSMKTIGEHKEETKEQLCEYKEEDYNR